MSLLEQDPSRLEMAAHRARETYNNVFDPNPPEFTVASVSPPTPLDRPHPDGGDIHEMTPYEKPQVVRSLAEAFEGDPNFTFMLRNEDKRLQRLASGILSFVENDWEPNGTIHTNDQLSGAAVWTDPGKWKADTLTQVRIFKSLVGVVTPAEVARLSYVLGFVEDKHEEIEHKKGEHYYLAMVGLTRQWQGLGWGDAMLKPMLNQCDEEGMPAYLESSTERSVPLYERNGFEVIARGSYRGATEPMHFMWREPQT